MTRCERCDGQGKIRVVYPHTPYPQCSETATLEKCEDCNGSGWIPDLSLSDTISQLHETLKSGTAIGMPIVGFMARTELLEAAAFYLERMERKSHEDVAAA